MVKYGIRRGRLPLNRTTAPQVIRLFDSCFKRGVIDSCNMEDDMLVKEFLDKHKSDGSYGLVYDDYNFDFHRWRFHLERWCREDRLGSIGDMYLNSMYVRQKRNTFLFAVLPLTMRFYLMGVEEWLSYPNPLNMAIFQHMKKIHWKPVPKHLKNISTADWLSYMQEFIYERQKMRLKGDLTEFMYDSFSVAMFKLTRKYEVLNYETEEDF